MLQNMPLINYVQITMNVTTGNWSVGPVWGEPSTTLSSWVTTVDGEGNQFTTPVTVAPEIEFELKWIEPLAIVMDGFFVMLALLLVAAFLFAKLAASARMRWGRRFEVDMRIGAGRMVGERPPEINERNVALRNLV